MSKGIIVVGMPTSGKTHYANSLISKDNSYIEINRENIRKKLFNIKGSSDYDFSIENEQLVTTEQFNQIRAALESGKNIIITDSNLKMTYIRRLYRFLDFYQADISIVMCDIPLLEAIRRNSNRMFPQKPEVIKNYYEAYMTIRDKVIHKYGNIVKIYSRGNNEH